MSKSGLLITTISVSLVLLAMIAISGCTGPSSGSATVPVTPAPSLTVSSVTSGSWQADYANITTFLGPRGDASNPSEGIDTLQLYVDLSSETGAIDLTKMELVLSTNRTMPVIYRLGTSDAIGTFTANDPPDNGGRPSTVIRPNEGVNIRFRVHPIPANSEGTITLRPAGGACTTANCEIGFVTPSVIEKINLL